MNMSNTIVSDLIAGMSVIWVVPATVPRTDLVTELADILEECAIDPIVDELPQSLRNVDAHQADEGASHVDIHSLDKLMTFAEREFIIAQLEGRGKVATAQSSETGRTSSVIVVVTDATFGYQANQCKHIAVHWFWGCFTTAEMSILAYYMSQNRAIESAHAAWVQSVMAELAGTDVGLLQELYIHWKPDFSEDDLFNILQEYATQQGWADECVSSHTKNVHGTYRAGRQNKPPCPPQQLALLFESGILEWRTDSGISLHTASLVQNGDSSEIRRRIWAGQAKYLMPIIDMERIKTCRHLEESDPSLNDVVDALRRPNLNSQNEWHSDYTTPEWGELISFIDTMYSGRYISLRRRANFMRMRRNDLAHCTPISWEHFRMVLTGEA
jgi:hypothetical protein